VARRCGGRLIEAHEVYRPAAALAQSLRRGACQRRQLAGAEVDERRALARGADADALLRVWLTARVGSLPTAAALHEFLRQALDAAPDRAPRLELREGTLRRYGDALYLVGPPPVLESSYPIGVPGTLELPHGVLRVEAGTAATARAARPAALQVAFRRGGERLRAGGVAKPLKQWFQEAGVLPWARAAYPLLYDARGLLAIPGIAWRDPGPAGPDGGARGDQGGAVRATWRPFPRYGGRRDVARLADAEFFL